VRAKEWKVALLYDRFTTGWLFPPLYVQKILPSLIVYPALDVGEQVVPPRNEALNGRALAEYLHLFRVSMEHPLNSRLMKE
jgi:hypothetical protein